MAVPPAWTASRHRLLFLGQETAHWTVPGDATLPGAGTLREVLALPDPLGALTRAYAAFDFGVAAPRVHFIRALRRLERELEGGRRGAVMWGNVGVIDAAPMGRASASIAALPRGPRERVLGWQRGLLAASIAALRPSAVLAASGPKYDAALAAEFAGLRFEPVGEAAPRDLARLVHPRLPAASFRTYHPRTLEITKAPHLGTAIAMIAGGADRRRPASES